METQSKQNKPEKLLTFNMKTEVSFDENMFVNKDSEEFLSPSAYQKELAVILTNVQQTTGIENGDRNNFIYKFASVACRNKIPFKSTKDYSIENFEGAGMPLQEIISTIDSAYQSIGNETNGATYAHTLKSLSSLSKVENYLNDHYKIRFNVVSTKIEIKKKNSPEDYKELNENSLYRELQHKNLNISIAKLSSLLQSDFVTEHNPFKDYFEQLDLWDALNEPDYIGQLCGYIPTEDPKRFHNHLEKMMVRCIACALEDRVFNKQVLVLVHSMQNSGKSTLCRWLCPPSLSAYIAENINTDKDSLIALATNFFINMDELATLSRQEINSLKSMISKDKINIRLPFAKKATVMPRRASFIGSTNKDEFLTDETGSVRWLCFQLTGKINFNYKKEISIDDIWRQAYTLYKSNYQYQLTPEDIEENEKANHTFQVRTVEVELIPKHYEASTKADGGIFHTASDIMCFLNTRHPSARMNINSVGKAMVMLGFKREQQYSEEKGYSQKGYYVKNIDEAVT